jgi:hypothetical protein
VRADHRLLRVDDQVEQDLLDLVGIGKHLRKAGRQRFENRDVADALLVGSQGQGLAHDLVEIHHRARGVTFPREGQEVADDLRRPLRFPEDGLQAAANLLVDLSLGKTLGPGENGRERIVQLVRDARNRLSERRQLLGLEELMIQVARLVFETFPLADVTHQRFDTQAVAAALGVSGDLDPHRRAIRAAQPHQVVGHRPVALKPLQETVPGLPVHEAIDVERSDGAVARLGAVAEHQFEVRVRGVRSRRGAFHGADVHSFVHRLEEAGERLGRRRLTRGCP